MNNTHQYRHAASDWSWQKPSYWQNWYAVSMMLTAYQFWAVDAALHVHDSNIFDVIAGNETVEMQPTWAAPTCTFHPHCQSWAGLCGSGSYPYLFIAFSHAHVTVLVHKIDEYIYIAFFFISSTLYITRGLSQYY